MAPNLADELALRRWFDAARRQYGPHANQVSLGIEEATWNTASGGFNLVSESDVVPLGTETVLGGGRSQLRTDLSGLRNRLSYSINWEANRLISHESWLLQQMIFHLDHPKSCTEATVPLAATLETSLTWAFLQDVSYENCECFGETGDPIGVTTTSDVTAEVEILEYPTGESIVRDFDSLSLFDLPCIVRLCRLRESNALVVLAPLQIGQPYALRGQIESENELEFFDNASPVNRERYEMSARMGDFQLETFFPLPGVQIVEGQPPYLPSPESLADPARCEYQDLFADPSCTRVQMECHDGLDNDCDGLADFPDDPDCYDRWDPSEAVNCSNGREVPDDSFTLPALRCGTIPASFNPTESENPLPDLSNPFFDCTAHTFAPAADLNQGDYPENLGCNDPNDPTEVFDCMDSIDNDGDGVVDYPFDAGCLSPTDTSEAPDCSDGWDNDRDGAPDDLDAGCSGPADPSELFQATDEGDLNGDGLIDANDASAIQGAMGSAMGDSRYRDGADLDDDGFITLVDYQLWVALERSVEAGSTAISGSACGLLGIELIPLLWLGRRGRQRRRKGGHGSTLLAGFAVVGLLAATDARALASVSLEPSSVTRGVGESFTIDIVADLSNPVLGWGLDVSFDDAVLDLQMVEVAPAWLSAATADGDDLAGLAFPSGLGGADILLATLHFGGLSPGVSALDLEVTDGDLSEGFALDPTGFDTLSLGSALVTIPEPCAAALLVTGLLGGLASKGTRGPRGDAK